MPEGQEVCRLCGVDVAQSKARGWIHTEEIPRGVKAHDAEPVERTLWEAARGYDTMQEQVQEARHYAEDLRSKMTREEMDGVVWSDQVRHTVMLLNALEAAEEVTLQAITEARLWKEGQVIDEGPAREPNGAAVRRIIRHLLGEDIVNIRAAVESFPNEYTVVPKRRILIENDPRD